VQTPRREITRRRQPSQGNARPAPGFHPDHQNDDDLLLWLRARLVADFGLTYKIELRNRLTAQPSLLSEASSGRNA
jgi:hypothetical protein